MANFHIEHEVRLFQPSGWQLCFQYGEYVYDPDQETLVDREHGYRFIWRKPNGHLQGARGQARLMPSWITILLGKAAEAGWYPKEPSSKVPAPGIAKPVA